MPYFSSGSRDDLVQNRFIAAHLGHWESGEQVNPLSSVYGTQMVPRERIGIWAWDARPFPEFPMQEEVWSDGPNWQRGHWLNGRLGGCPLDDLIEAILEDHAVPHVFPRVDGFIDGFVIGEVAPLRASLEPLAGLFNLAVREEEGRLSFTGKGYLEDISVSADDLVQEEDGAAFAGALAGEGDLPREITLNHGELFLEYENATSQSRRLETSSDRSVSMSLPAIMPATSATGLAEARLRDAWIARKQARFGVSWKYLALEAGDLVSVVSEETAGQKYRIGSIEDGAYRALAATGFAHFAETGPAAEMPRGKMPPITGFGIPQIVLMNLPLGMDAMEPEPAVHIAVWAKPWASAYSVSASPGTDGFSSRAIIREPSQIFTLDAPLAPGPLGRWDMANRITLAGPAGDLESLDRLLVLSGENALAVEADNGEWEIVQFRNADLGQDGKWQLSGLLRGQLGTDPAMLSGASSGNRAVLLDGAVTRIPVSTGEVGLELNWRIGPVVYGVAGLSSAFVQSFNCNAANRRPLSPAHLRVVEQADGTIAASWIRRSRVGSDSWENPVVPLDEPAERWSIIIRDASQNVVRTEEAGTSAFAYGENERIADLGSAGASFSFEVAQISAAGLAGPPASLAWPN